jgi:hypothetical protein
MALRTPLLLENPATADMQITSYDSFLLAWLHSFAPYAYANNPSGPSAKLEVNTSNGTLMSGQPFVDTYYIAGDATYRVDAYATEAETPNISMVTDNYNRLRVVYPSLSLPTGDTNNLQYPLYLYDDGGVIQLRAMNRQDFIDTCVIPALDTMTIWSAGTTNQQAGTYFLTTSATPANATLVSATPVAVNSVANVAAYTADGINEVLKQTIDTNYYLAMVNYAPTTYDVYDATTLTYYLPLYFDAGTESIRQHTPTTWAALLGPFLRYYLATPGTGYYIGYNLSSGNQKGTTYTDTRVTPTGTGYNQRFVGVDDYRTQEFPTGTATTISANTKALYITQNSSVTETIVLSGTTSIPNMLSGEQPVYNAVTGLWDIDNGFAFGPDGYIYEWSYSTPGNVVGALIYTSSEWCNTTPSATYYIRITQEIIPFNVTQIAPNAGDTLGVWHALTTIRSVRWAGSANFGAYGERKINVKVEIATDSGGTNIVATGYYQNVWEGGA